MENFIVSARKYRPASFDTVVGQSSITVTLKNAILSKQLAHAYLFCGPRGVGKTTCARIFAKTINCSNLSPENEACNECESCHSFNQGRSYNIHELDAASNNSVDDIRNLIDQVRIPPQIGHYSVYIIDEVHMLSSQAFNAFLKTLEEPPSHAIFVLATTEKHKILPTILSRCQIFDFHRMKVEDTVKHLANIAEKENVSYELDGLNVIARKADGAMRDALSLFDQIVSFSGKNITYKNVIENLNVLDYDYYFRLTDYFLQSNISLSLLTFNEILDKGFDPHHFITGLAGHFRDLLVCKDEKTLELMEVGATIRENYKTQAQMCGIDFLYYALNIANTCDLNYRDSQNKRLLVELALLQLSYVNRKKHETSVQETSQTSEQKTVETVKQNPVETKTSGMPSIQNFINNIQKKNDEPNLNAEKKNDFSQLISSVSQDEVRRKWQEFVQPLKNEKPVWFSLIGTRIPNLKDNFIIEISVNAAMQKEKIENDICKELLNFLRKELKNDKLDLNILVVEIPVENLPKMVSNPEKYKYLSTKNPFFHKLKQQFDLDFCS